MGDQRRDRLEAAIQATAVVPVSDALLSTIALLRHGCRVAGHPFHDRGDANDLRIAASAIQTGAVLLTADNVFDTPPVSRCTSRPEPSGWVPIFRRFMRIG
jgi:predicted nucleic acid-binding protein